MGLPIFGGNRRTVWSPTPPPTRHGRSRRHHGHRGHRRPRLRPQIEATARLIPAGDHGGGLDRKLCLRQCCRFTTPPNFLQAEPCFLARPSGATAEGAVHSEDGGDQACSGSARRSIPSDCGRVPNQCEAVCPALPMCASIPRSHGAQPCKHRLPRISCRSRGHNAGCAVAVLTKVEREQFEGLSDREVLRKSARELCISTIWSAMNFF